MTKWRHDITFLFIDYDLIVFDEVEDILTSLAPCQL